jgi:hypothetical protein
MVAIAEPLDVRGPQRRRLGHQLADPGRGRREHRARIAPYEQVLRDLPGQTVSRAIQVVGSVRLDHGRVVRLEITGEREDRESRAARRRRGGPRRARRRARPCATARGPRAAPDPDPRAAPERGHPSRAPDHADLAASHGDDVRARGARPNARRDARAGEDDGDPAQRSDRAHHGLRCPLPRVIRRRPVSVPARCPGSRARRRPPPRLPRRSSRARGARGCDRSEPPG